MAEQVFWEDVEVGSEVPPLPKVATSQMLVKWAGAVMDWSPLHWDDFFCANQGVETRIIHGELKRAWLVQLMTDWIGEQGILRKIACQYRALDHPRPMKTPTEPVEGETWWCRGKVSAKYVEGDEHCIDCEIWVENGKGEVTTPGAATVVLPIRG
jgi:acyl dehydratase